MRKAYPDCDKRTTGVDDADARIDRARAEASRIMATARAAFPHMNSRTMLLVDRHFHCPSNQEILDIKDALPRIDKMIPSQVRLPEGRNRDGL